MTMATVVPQWRVGAPPGAGRRDAVVLAGRAELLHPRQFLRDDAVQRRARPARGRADAGHRGRRHRPLGRVDDGARRGDLWRQLPGAASSPAAGRRVRGAGRSRRRRAECAAHREAEAAGVDRHARDLLAVSRRRRRHDPRRGQLHRISLRVPVPGPGVPGRPRPRAAAAVRGDRRGLRGPAPSIGRRPRVVRDRIHRAGRALRGDSGRQARGAGLRPVGIDRQRRRGHLCRASGAGAIGCGPGLRARRDHRGGAGRHVGLWRPRHDRGNAAGALRPHRSADRAAPGRLAVRADRRPDRGPAARHDCHRSSQPPGRGRAR